MKAELEKKTFGVDETKFAPPRVEGVQSLRPKRII